MRSTSCSATESPEDSSCAVKISSNKVRKMRQLEDKDHSFEEQRKRKRSCSSDITSCDEQELIYGNSSSLDTLMVLKERAINPFRLRKEPEVNQVLHVSKTVLATNAAVSPHLTKTDKDSGMDSKRNDNRNQKKVKGYTDISSPVSCGYELEAQTTEVLEDISKQKLGNGHHGVRHQIPKVASLVKLLSPDAIDWDSSIYREPKLCHVPIGPHFQADIPEWTGSMKFDSYCSIVDNAADLRWLGTRVWPMEGKTTNVLLKDIGKGRNENCSCPSPGSIECVNQHVLEERHKLQSELHSAFRTWQIDEMGEAMTKSWTNKMHKSFNSLVKKSMLPKGVVFWKHASKCFRGMSDKDLVQYFLNVYIPRRIGLQTRLSLKCIDTDDSEDGEDVDDSECKAECVRKSRYLHGR